MSEHCMPWLALHAPVFLWCFLCSVVVVVAAVVEIAHYSFEKKKKKSLVCTSDSCLGVNHAYSTICILRVDRSFSVRVIGCERACVCVWVIRIVMSSGHSHNNLPVFGSESTFGARELFMAF